MTPPPTVTRDELHGYVDGALDPDSRARVERWLAENPDDAAKVAAYTGQNEAFHAAFDGILAEPVPAAMAVRPASGPAPRNRAAAWWRVAAAILLLVTGGATGWFLRGETAPPAFTPPGLAHNAISAHSIYIKERRHAVEVEAKEEKHLVRWLSKRLGQPIRMPNLLTMGFRLVGGRLLPDDGKPAAQFMYENDKGSRLTIYVRRNIESRELAFQFVSEKDTSAFYWLDENFAYALVGDLGREGLHEAAKIIHKELAARN